MKDMGTKSTTAFGLLAAATMVAGTIVAPESIAAQQQDQVSAAAPALEWDPNDPRIGLGGGRRHRSLPGAHISLAGR